MEINGKWKSLPGLISSVTFEGLVARGDFLGSGGGKINGLVSFNLFLWSFIFLPTVF